MATPDDFGIGLECQRDFPFHSFSHIRVISGVLCVSWNKAMSMFVLIIYSKAAVLLSFLCSPFMFKVSNCIVWLELRL